MNDKRVCWIKGVRLFLASMMLRALYGAQEYIPDIKVFTVVAFA
jgi:hypothetical protein